ncbi:kinase-like domain-containing protein, partial [Epithele typhae]|uniref:kinase-like domain-containing protein n=1 Tax=Epithele typhae TaxID=378194 RepID=UPI0020079862
GEGAQAHVCLVQAKRPRSHRRRRHEAVFAMKVISKRSLRDEQRNEAHRDRKAIADRKNRELNALSGLPWNPFIAGVVDAFIDSHNTYIMLEYAPCATLYELQERPWQPKVAKFYFANIALGLEFLHSHGIVHRDIKTENVLINADGYAMITDMGYAHRVDAATDWRGFHIGTLEFMSPEVVFLNYETFEERFACDWWSLAVILFELLFKKPPVQGCSIDELEDELFDERQTASIDDKTMPPLLRDYFRAAFKYDISRRRCCRSVVHKGTLVNEEIRQEPYLSDIPWGRIERRIELAPLVADPAPDPTTAWRAPFPMDIKVPGLRSKRPSARFLDDDILQDEDLRPKKKRRFL